MKNKKLPAVIYLLMISATVFANPKSNDEGKTIFSSRCAACHNVNAKVVGPALAGVDERHSMDWIISFVHSSQTLVKNNDKTAIELFHQFNNTVMPDHPDLSDEQIRNIVAYIKSQTKTGQGDNAPFARPVRLQPDYLPIAITNIWFFFSYVAMVFLLAGLLLLAVRVKELLRKRENDIGKRP